MVDSDLSAARAAQVTPLRPDYQEHGVAGTRVVGGRIWDYEKNKDLRGEKWVRECEEMRRTDPAVAQNVWAVKQTLLSARWRVAPPPDVPPEYAQMVGRAVAYLGEAFGIGRRGRLRGGWESFLRVALEFLFLGWRYFEEVYEVADGKVWLKRFADREPSAHAAWEFDDAGEVAWVEQIRVPSAGGRAARRGDTPRIPANRLLLLTLDRTGSNVEGLGILRPCHYYYDLKRHATDMLAAGLERWAIPTPIIKTDTEALKQAGWSDAKIDVAVAKATDNVKNLTSHQNGYLRTVVGVDIEPFGEGVFDPAAADSVVKLCNDEMAGAFLLSFLRLGVRDTGSRAVGVMQETFFGRACVNILDMVAGAVGGLPGPGTGTAGRLLRWNFPRLPEALYPTLEHDGLTASPLLELATSGALTNLISVGQWTPDNETEAALRLQVRAPVLARGAERSPTERIAGGSIASAAAGREAAAPAAGADETQAG